MHSLNLESFEQAGATQRARIESRSGGAEIGNRRSEYKHLSVLRAGLDSRTIADAGGESIPAGGCLCTPCRLAELEG